jgi:hypothetical protein
MSWIAILAAMSTVFASVYLVFIKRLEPWLVMSIIGCVGVALLMFYLSFLPSDDRAQAMNELKEGFINEFEAMLNFFMLKK